MSLVPPTGHVSYIYIVEVQPSENKGPVTGKPVLFNAWRHLALMVKSKGDVGKSLKICRLNDGVNLDCVLYRDTVTQLKMEANKERIMKGNKVEFPMYTIKDRISNEKILEIVHCYDPRKRGNDRFMDFRFPVSKWNKTRREVKVEINPEKKAMQFFNEELCQHLKTKGKWETIEPGSDELGHIFYRPKVNLQ